MIVFAREGSNPASASTCGAPPAAACKATAHGHGTCRMVDGRCRSNLLPYLRPLADVQAGDQCV